MMLVFRSGQIALTWEEGSDGQGSHVIDLVHARGPLPYKSIAIETPAGLKYENEAFTVFCCEFLGMMMGDKPTFTTVSDPVPRDRHEEEFVVGLKGPIAELPKGTVLSPVLEAQA